MSVEYELTVKFYAQNTNPACYESKIEAPH